MGAKGIGKLIKEITAVMVMCAVCLWGMHFFLRFVCIPEKATDLVIFISAS